MERFTSVKYWGLIIFSKRDFCMQDIYENNNNVKYAKLWYGGNGLQDLPSWNH
jgi:hypothetical protein